MERAFGLLRRRVYEGGRWSAPESGCCTAVYMKEKGGVRLRAAAPPCIWKIGSFRHACTSALFFGSLLLYGPKFTNKVFAGPLGRTIARWNGLGAWNANPLCDIIYFIAKKCWWVW